MSKFVATFHEKQFWNILPDLPVTTSEISRRVGCSTPTTTTYMEKLAEQGKVSRVEIIGGRDVVWQKVV